MNVPKNPISGPNDQVNASEWVGKGDDSTPNEKCESLVYLHRGSPWVGVRPLS